VLANNNQALTANKAFPSLFWQLKYGLSAQTEILAKSNNIQKRLIQCQDSHEDSKKDQTKKIHPSIIRMICRAAASRGNETEVLPETCIRFFNQESVEMAQFNLVHQFKDLKAPDVTFPSGTTNALYIGQFLWADSSIPSNFTIFAFREQEPNTNNRQEDFLVCHLLQEEGQKKSVDEIKASLEQSVHVPSNIYNLGIQVQLFEKAARIFFGEESVLTKCLSNLHYTIAHNKKCFQDQIALDKFFPAKFLLAIDQRVRRWLKSYEQAENS
jgi:hypothetical protein